MGGAALVCRSVADEHPETALRLSRARITLAFDRGGVLPPYPGSALRGLLGHGLRRVFCITGRRECAGCALLARCRYVSLFEPRRGHTLAGGRLVRPPQPWVLGLAPRYPSAVEAGETLQFFLTLMGPAREALSWIALGLDHAGRLGLGRDRATFVVDDVCVEHFPGSNRWVMPPESAAEVAWPGSAPVPATPARGVAVQLLTPLRLRRRGRLVRPVDFSPDRFLEALWARIHDLLLLYGEPVGGTMPDLPLPRTAAPGPKSDLHWVDWARYSSRQRTHMKMGGIVGRFFLDGETVTRWWRYLWLGQWVHVGKQTSMGLGAYRLVPGL